MIYVDRKTTIVIIKDTVGCEFAFEGGNANKLKEIATSYGTIYFYRVDSGANFVLDEGAGLSPSHISAYGAEFYDSEVIPVPIYGDTLIINIS